ncbi:MAG: DUF5063 domain-containing protein [Bacteroidales bacterium]|jgi:hypothetical protein|nr:DUF5063 domain-containing protein [Bacteroidales bacterium]
MNKIESLIAPQTKEFIKTCRKYFEYLETLPDKKITDFWGVQLNMLSEIYNGVFSLPEIEARYSSDVDKFVNEKSYNKIFTSLLAYIGALDSFPDFSDLSHPGALKVMDVSLSEILTDVYQEIKDFVLLYETGTLENMNDAIAECAETFGQYWGVKLLSALRIMHVNLYQHRYAETKKTQQLEIDIDEVIGDYDGEEE